MLKDKSLRWILIFSLLVALATPLLNTLYVSPEFYEVMIHSIERESRAVCSHIGRNIITDEYWDDWLSQGMVPDFISDDLNTMIGDLGLIKIKFFLADGRTIYSNDIADVGKINRHEYFHRTVAAGNVYSKLVRKGSESLEGARYQRGVVETYVPIMRDGKFSGAFELYYDVTGEIENINSLALQASMIPAFVAVLFVILVFRTLRNLHQTICDRQRAELDLTEALDSAWQLTEALEEKNSELLTVNEEVEKSHNELQLAQSQMLQKEKMASIGQLAAGVAHEINNPMGFISSNLSTMRKYLERMTEYLDIESTHLAAENYAGLLELLTAEKKRLKLKTVVQDAPELIAESLEGAERVKAIVQNLKTFSRVDEAVYKPSDINACIESTINIVWNEIKYKAELHRDFGDLPQVNCYPQQINQVVMNLLVNSAQAIENRGEIMVKTWCDESQVYISIADNGSGMPPGVQQKIFEPFFTTKDVGKGTGLGMSIAYEIMKKHGGDIQLESEPGKGTTFTLVLPVSPPDEVVGSLTAEEPVQQLAGQ